MLRRAGTGTARNGAVVIADVTGGVLALLVLIYLVVALLRPERF
ncbi:K(+)-transporting ATPase subunit F [Pseudonocardia phyllosphaerae]